MKQYLKKYFLFLIIFFPILGCKKDDEQITKPSSETSLNIQTHQIQSLITKALEKGDLQNAEKYALKQKEIAERSQYVVDLALAYENLGKIANRQNKAPLALENYLKSFSLIDNKNIATSSRAAKIAMRIGNIYYSKHGFQKALIYYQKAQIYFEKNYQENIENIGLNYQNIALTYEALKNFSQAFTYYQKAYNLLEKTGDINIKISLLRDLGAINMLLKNYDASLNYYKIALSLVNNENSSSKIYNNLGRLYILQSNYSEAKTYLEKALSSSTIDPEIEATAKRNLGYVYLQEKNYSVAEDYLKKSEILAQEANLKEDLLEAYLYLSDLYKATGNATKALDYYKFYASVKEELNEAQQLSFAKGLDETMQAETKATSFISAFSKPENTNKLPYIIGVVAILGLFTYLLVYFARSRQKMQMAFTTEHALVVQEKSEKEMFLKKLVETEKEKENYLQKLVVLEDAKLAIEKENVALLKVLEDQTEALAEAESINDFKDIQISRFVEKYHEQQANIAELKKRLGISDKDLQ